MNGKDLILLPKCPHPEHGEMIARKLLGQTQEQRYCGAWYDCKEPGCSNSALIPSKEIRDLYRLD
ncbi:MAG TPA: hypothetical protein VFD33_02685 [Bacillota bacterium]|nr:hypothetical protein [Bacillota bacterium]